MDDISNSEKLVLLVLYDWEKPIRLGDLFNRLKRNFGFFRSRQTLHSLIRKLRNNYFLYWEPHKSVKLSDLGKERALHVTWHMHLLEEYFAETLDLSEESIRKEAIRLTPLVSCDFTKALVRKYHKACGCQLKEAIKDDQICL